MIYGRREHDRRRHARQRPIDVVRRRLLRESRVHRPPAGASRGQDIPRRGHGRRRDGSGHGTFNARPGRSRSPTAPRSRRRATDPEGTRPSSRLGSSLSLAPVGGPAGRDNQAQVKGLVFAGRRDRDRGGAARHRSCRSTTPTRSSATCPALPAGSDQCPDASPTRAAASPGDASATAGSPTSSTFRPATSSTRRSTKLVVQRHHGRRAAAATTPSTSTSRRVSRWPSFCLKAKYGVCLRAAGSTAPASSPTCPAPRPVRELDRGARGRGHHGRLRRRQLLPRSIRCRRDQMAAFLLKAKHGSSYVPPACVGDFPGRAVPGAVRRLDRAARRPRASREAVAAATTARDQRHRGQMAAFLVNTFSLP